MIEKLETLIGEYTKWLNEISGGNEFLSGALAIWILGSLTYICRNVPLQIYTFVKKQITTEVTINNYDVCFYDVLKWLNKQGYANKFRKIKLNNGKWGSDDLIKSIGYGNHFIWYNYYPLRLRLTKEETNNSSKIVESITFAKVGRGHKIFDNIIRDAISQKNKDNTTKIFNFIGDYWQEITENPYRKMESVAIEKNKLGELINGIDTFLKQEQWYIDSGIPYQLGILLYGPPGTGKTSLIKAIAAYLKKDIYFTNNLLNIKSMIRSLRDNGILVIEDIDSSTALHNRDEDDEDDIVSTLARNASPENLSEVLNSIDGIMSKHGRILIATTNHLEKLDKALIRPGRFDIKIEVGYLNQETFNFLLKKFFNQTTDRKLQPVDLTGAQLQQDILNKLEFEEIVEKYCAFL